ncbi:MAG TPA: cellulose biosynthesis protein BcsD [Fontimonas sp.]
MDAKTYETLSNRPPFESTEPVLRSLTIEFANHIADAQLRTLAYLAGQRLAKQYPIDGVQTIDQFEQQANTLMTELSWGWVTVEAKPSSIDFVHGCTPLKRWFGEMSMSWAPGLFEGVFAGWMRQLGASELLDVREVIAADAVNSETLRFRFAHQSTFA